MAIALDQLPDDIDALKSLVAEQAARNEALQSKVLSLQEQLNLALARRYAASSEKISPGQLRLFNEAEAGADTSEEDEAITIPAHSRRKRGRKKLPERLPRVEVIHEAPEEARICPHDGNPLTEIGEVVSEQLDIIPAKLQVLRHVRKQYACRGGQCIQTPPPVVVVGIRGTAGGLVGRCRKDLIDLLES